MSDKAKPASEAVPADAPVVQDAVDAIAELGKLDPPADNPPVDAPVVETHAEADAETTPTDTKAPPTVKVDEAKVKAEAEKLAVEFIEIAGVLEPEAQKTYDEYKEWKGVKGFCSATLRTGSFDENGQVTANGKVFTRDQLERYKDEADEKLIVLAPEAAKIRKDLIADLMESRKLKLQIAKAKATPAPTTATRPSVTVKPAAASTKPKLETGRPVMNEAEFVAKGRTKEAAIEQLGRL